VLIILKLRVKITGEWGAARNSPLPDLPTTDAARTTCKTKQITKQTKTIQLQKTSGTKRKSGIDKKLLVFLSQEMFVFRVY
jgi:hypothetical protein